jgi:hypothetical protein
VTHTEVAHVLFGLGVAVVAVGALRAFHKPTSVARFVWPVATIIVGIFLFIPVERQTCTYSPYEWFDTVLSAFPDDLSEWSAMLSKLHVVQHKIGGLLSVIIGAIELGRSAGRLSRPVWGRLLPYFSIAIGLAIGIHGGTHVHLPFAVEQLHHWIFGFCFVGGGVILAIHQAGLLRSTRWRDSWALLLLLAGIDLMVFYRLPADANLQELSPDCSVVQEVSLVPRVFR